MLIQTQPRALIRAGLVIGMGIGGFFDSLLHVVAWIIILVGIYLLWRALEALDWEFPVRILAGTLFIGWGLFNLVEGILDDYILKTHPVRSGPHQAFWDAVFLVWGALMVLGGWWMTRSQTRRVGDMSTMYPARSTVADPITKEAG